MSEGGTVLSKLEDFEKAAEDVLDDAITKNGDKEHVKYEEETVDGVKTVTIRGIEDEVLEVAEGCLLKMNVSFRLRKIVADKDKDVNNEKNNVRNMKITIPVNMNGTGKDSKISSEMVHEKDIGEITVTNEKMVKINIPMKVQRAGDTGPVLPLNVTVPVKIEKNTFKRPVIRKKPKSYYCCSFST